jgi:hypothetical protein
VRGRIERQRQNLKREKKIRRRDPKWGRWRTLMKAGSNEGKQGEEVQLLIFYHLRLLVNF